jgi:hypothetical protein
MHHIRDKFKTGEIIPVHQGGNELVPDVMTKDTGPSRFLFFRDHLLGIRRTPTQLTTSAFLTRLLSTAPSYSNKLILQTLISLAAHVGIHIFL